MGDPVEIEGLKHDIGPLAFYQRELPEFQARRTQGWVDGGLCPFHDDRHAGSFRVNLDTGAFRCFACGAHGGDIIEFVRLRDKCSFLEAIDRLGRDWGYAK